MNSGSVEWLQAIELERDLTLSDWNKAKEMEKEQKRIKLPSHYEILDKAQNGCVIKYKKTMTNNKKII